MLISGWGTYGHQECGTIQFNGGMWHTPQWQCVVNLEWLTSGHDAVLSTSIGGDQHKLIISLVTGDMGAILGKNLETKTIIRADLKSIEEEA